MCRRRTFPRNVVSFFLLSFLVIVPFSRGQEGGDSFTTYRYQPGYIDLAAAVHEPLLPKDEALGKLSDSSSLSGESKKILEYAQRFMDSLAEGNPEETLLAAEGRSALSLYISPLLENYPEDVEVRYCTPKFGGSSRRHSAILQFRLVTSSDTVKEEGIGELLFKWTGEQWRIVVVHLPLHEKNMVE